MTENENHANVLEYKPIEMFCYLFKAKVYKDNWSAQNLNNSKENKGFVKKYNPDLLVTLFGGVRSKIREVGRNGTIETR